MFKPTTLSKSKPSKSKPSGFTRLFSLIKLSKVASVFVVSTCFCVTSFADSKANALKNAALKPGVYSGKFGIGKATLFIDHVPKSGFTDGKITGRSLYKHNLQKLTGTVVSEDDHWRITLNEPKLKRGHGVGNGRFHIVVNKSSPTTFTGTWVVYKNQDTKKGIPAKSFRFKKTRCSVTSDSNYAEYLEDLSKRVHKDDELMMPAEELDYLRNSIYAYKGYSFKTNKLQEMFADDDEYVPCYTDISNKLNKIEKENISRMKQVAEYARKNPDMFGR